ncbi:MAG: hypothetical protein CL723_01150 [Chloroflexi bacterium]|nr:hypothetical protein [Chloroflexota bacterium]|tara:strand:- start:8812 stop:10005 length:1194 start_codon:yes stop_codon:yes gene_type:complete
MIDELLNIIINYNNFIYWYICLLIIAFFTIVTGITNFLWLKKIPTKKNIPKSKLVSILIPARNEADIIESTIKSIVNQSYQNFELIILDDNSSDSTKSIIQKQAKKNSKIELINGLSLPPGWLGKNWACHQLSEKAKGEYILFIDADTNLDKFILEDSVITLQKDKIDLLSLVPGRDTKLIADHAMKKIISWFIVCWLPMKLAINLNAPFLSATFGQFMLFKKSSFNDIGGFEAIKDNPVDDFQLGRNIKKNMFKWMLYDAAFRITTRTYNTNKDLISGYSKNIFPAVGYSISIFLIIFLILISFVLGSTIPIILYALGILQNQQLILLCISLLILLFVSWEIVTIRFKYSIFTPFSFPLLISLILLLAARSFIYNIFYSSTWKGRSYRTSKKKLKI